jgi:hypothetical protein
MADAPRIAESLGLSSGAGEYTVSQLNLAAYLLAVGHELLEVRPTRGRNRRYCEFIFRFRNGIVEDCSRYREHRATVDAHRYAETLLGLKRRAINTLEEVANVGKGH